MEKLTDKQEKFCDEYLVDLNATQAAIRSGVNISNSAAKTGFYVYLLINPIDGKIFYIGKGKGNRSKSHYNEYRSNKVINAVKFQKISEIAKAGSIPEILYFDTELTESDAYKIERFLIKKLRCFGLTNISGGIVKPKDSVKAWAEHKLKTAIPFNDWCAIKHRTEQEIEIYHLITKELKDIIENGIITAVEVKTTKNGSEIKFIKQY